MAENFLDDTGDKPISWWMFAGTQTGLPAKVTFLGANPDIGAYERE